MSLLAPISCVLAMTTPQLVVEDVLRIHEDNWKNTRLLEVTFSISDNIWSVSEREKKLYDEFHMPVGSFDLHQRVHWTTLEDAQSIHIVDYRDRLYWPNGPKGSTIEICNGPFRKVTLRNADNTCPIKNTEARDWPAVAYIRPASKSHAALQLYPDVYFCRSFWIGNKCLSLREVAALGTSALTERTEIAPFGKCRAMECKYGNGILRVYLSETYRMLPCRVLLLDTAGKLMSEFNVKKVAALSNGAFFPTLVEFTSPSGFGARTVYEVSQISIPFDKAAKDLVPKFPEWCRVHDHIEHKVHVWGVDAPRITFNSPAEYSRWFAQVAGPDAATTALIAEMHSGTGSHWATAWWLVLGLPVIVLAFWRFKSKG